jgi:hypothetical protein
MEKWAVIADGPAGNWGTADHGGNERARELALDSLKDDPLMEAIVRAINAEFGPSSIGLNGRTILMNLQRGGRGLRLLVGRETDGRCSVSMLVWSDTEGFHSVGEVSTDAAGAQREMRRLAMEYRLGRDAR